MNVQGYIVFYTYIVDKTHGHYKCVITGLMRADNNLDVTAHTM